MRGGKKGSEAPAAGVEAETPLVADAALPYSMETLAAFDAVAEQQPANAVGERRPFFGIERKADGFGAGVYRVVAKVAGKTYPLTDWDMWQIAIATLARLAEAWTYERLGDRMVLGQSEHAHVNYTHPDYNTTQPEAVTSGAFRGGEKEWTQLHIIEGA